ncbi:hypothetical protein [Nonomuraea sp. B1E8]|uniref:hypothetical protein n=1 Tax=unclassified Nonomuraea TaxID=2593643 RepID=UPI00325CC1BB
MLKPYCADWSVDTGGRSVEEVVTFINGFDATGIEQASTAYNDAHSAANIAKEAIRTQAGRLAEVWEGPSSVEAQEALGLLYVSLGELAEKLKNMSTPIGSLATVVRKHQEFIQDGWKGIMPTWANQGGLGGGTWNDSIADGYSVYSGYYAGDNARGDWGSQDELAGLHLKTFGEDLYQVHADMPDTLQTTLRDIKPPQMPDDGPDDIDLPQFPDQDPGDVTPTAYDGDDPSGPPIGDPRVTVPSDGPDGPSGPTPTTPGDPETGQGDDPSTGSPTTPDADGQNPGGQDPNAQSPGASTNGGRTPDPDVGAGSPTDLQEHQPTSNGSPLGTGPQTGSGNPSTSSSPGATSGGPSTYGNGGPVAAAASPSVGGRPGMNGMGMPFMPMGGMGGAGGQEGQDRESSTWLHEDDDIWGGDTDSVVNSKIG